MDRYTYLALDVLTVAFPLAASFEPRLRYIRSLRHLLPALLITAFLFIVWDAFFTYIGVWSFNPVYVSGWYLLGLPVEEWLFFFTVPYSCVFIYECIGHFRPGFGSSKTVIGFAVLLSSALFITGLVNLSRWYTATACIGAGIGLGLHLLVFRDWLLTRFFIAFAFSMLPFLLVNGVLTYWPVVLYNNSENCGIRYSNLTGIPFLNIPLEDTAYCLLLLIMNISLFEWFRRRRYPD